MARLELIWWDVRHAARALVSGRLFTVVAVLCLTLGISTNTTIFSVFDAMFWRPLPFADPDRLVSVAGRDPQTNRRVALSLDDVRQLASTVPSLAALAVYTGRSLTLNDGGEPERVSAQLVSANLFSTLGVAPGRGRSFDATEDQLVGARRRRDQRRAVAPALPGRSRSDRPRDPARQPAVHDRRRDAADVQVSGHEATAGFP